MFRPLRDRILVKPIERRASETLHVLHNELPTEGEVVAVGPGKRVNGRIIPLDAKVGDRIKFGEGAYLKFPEFRDGKTLYLVLQEADIAGVVETAS